MTQVSKLGLEPNSADQKHKGLSLVRLTAWPRHATYTVLSLSLNILSLHFEIMKYAKYWPSYH